MQKTLPMNYCRRACIRVQFYAHLYISVLIVSPAEETIVRIFSRCLNCRTRDRRSVISSKDETRVENIYYRLPFGGSLLSGKGGRLRLFTPSTKQEEKEENEEGKERLLGWAFPRKVVNFCYSWNSDCFRRHKRTSTTSHWRRIR